MQPLHIRRVHLVTVAMALPYGTDSAVEFTYTRPFSILLEHGRTQPKAHRSAHMSTRDLGHEDDNWVRRFCHEFGRSGTCGKSTRFKRTVERVANQEGLEC